MKALLRAWLAHDRAARTTIRGTIIDQGTNRPVRDARISTDLHEFTDEGFVRTDELGRFRLTIAPGSTMFLGPMELRHDLKHVPVWARANGYALALRFVPVGDTTRAEDLTIGLKPEAPLFGTVVDPSGRPVAGAVVEVAPVWATFMTGGPKPDNFVDHLMDRLQVRTDQRGRFSFPGIPGPHPRGADEIWTCHPEFQIHAKFEVQIPTDPHAAPVLTLEPGCTVSGVVVNRNGSAVPGASVRVFQPVTPYFLVQTAYTDRDGRFQFRNVRPGRMRIVVEAQRLAASWAEVVASSTRPAENQFVLEPGDSVGGKVIDKAGKPVARAYVSCVVVGSDEGATFDIPLTTLTATGEDGSFRLGLLPRGELRLTAEVESQGLTGWSDVQGNRADVVITVAEESDPP